MGNHLGKKLTEQLSPPESMTERHLAALLQIARSIGTIRDIHQLVPAAMNQVTSAFGADRASVFLHNKKRHELHAFAADGLDNINDFYIPDDFGLAGKVFQTHQPMLIRDTAESEYFSRDLAEEIGYMPRSMLIVPMLHDATQCMGVLEVMDERVGFFSEADLQLAEAAAVQIAIAYENARLHEAQARQFDSFIRAFSSALDARDPTTQIHSINVANYAVGIAHCLGLGSREQEWLRVAGLLHDVGKIGTPEDVLSKPGRLTDEEMAIMQDHALQTRNILTNIEFTDEYADMAFISAAHHERLDGSGYPDGLYGPQIPLKARILAVADVFHALTQDRPYRPGMNLDKALHILDNLTPNQLDERCVDALKAFLGVTYSGMAA